MPTKTSQSQITVQFIARLAADGCVELIVDATGAYTAKDALKANGFRFISNPAAGLGADAPLDRNGNRKNAPVWRKVLLAVPKGSGPAQTINATTNAVKNIQELVSGVLSTARIRGAKAASHTLAEHWNTIEGIPAMLEKLAAMDTPWLPNQPLAVVAIEPEDA